MKVQIENLKVYKGYLKHAREPSIDKRFLGEPYDKKRFQTRELTEVPNAWEPFVPLKVLSGTLIFKCVGE